MLDHSGRAGRPAGFWIRAVAALVDLLVVALVRSALRALAARSWGPGVAGDAGLDVTVGTFVLLFTCLYTTVLHAHGGQTLGKLVTGIRVMGVEGEPLLPGAALLRYLGYFASLGTLGMGFVMAGLRRDRRALHDLLAGSRVERLPAPAGVSVARGPAPAPGDVEASTATSSPHPALLTAGAPSHDPAPAGAEGGAAAASAPGLPPEAGSTGDGSSRP